jgi:replicative DNA helicase
MPMRFYDATWCIEAAGADLAAFAKERGTVAVLGVDSVQAARSATEGGKTSRYDEVTARVAAIRSVASEHRMLVIATSEMSRGAYRDPKNKINDMAAGKESGAIEYSARLLLSLRNVPKEPDLIELRIVKSKLGPSTRDEEQGIVLRMDRASQTGVVLGVHAHDGRSGSRTDQEGTP